MFVDIDVAKKIDEKIKELSANTEPFISCITSTADETHNVS